MPGPALAAAAPPVIEKRPAPIIAPMPSATSEVAERVFFSPLSDSLASASRLPKGFFTNKLMLGWFELKIIENLKNEAGRTKAVDGMWIVIKNKILFRRPGFFGIYIRFGQ